MWSSHHRDRWTDLDALEVQKVHGNTLEVSGFVFADPFDTFLRNISVGYLQSAWYRLKEILPQYQLSPSDLSWGQLHPGETFVEDIEPPPGYFLGWTSQELADFYKDRRYPLVDAALAQGRPMLRCATTRRSHKWRIAPDDFSQALRLIEAFCTDEISEWSPEFLLERMKEPKSPWLDMAAAMRDENQNQFNQATQAAKEAYSPLGYRIVVRGFAAYLQSWQAAGEYLKLSLPEV